MTVRLARRLPPWRTTAVLVAAVAVLLAAAPPAGAGTYTVETCSNGSLSGWSHFNFGDWSTWSNGCGTLGSGLAASTWVVPGSSAGWTFTAPAGTDIAGFRLTRSYSLPANRPYGTGVVTLRTEGPGQGYFDSFPNFGGAAAAGPEQRAASGLRGQTSLTAKVDCGGGAECTGSAYVAVYGASIDLRDDSSPTISSVSGSLATQGTVKGIRSLSYAAGDQGGGLRREVLAVDGVPQSDRALECTFALTVPCPLNASGTLQLDTTRFADGDHDVELSLWDATLTNRTTYGPIRISVDNIPAPAAAIAPRIYGTAARGTTLYADDGTWTGAGLTLTRRWQRHEEGAWEDIAGAEGAGYAPAAEDVGHRLRFRVRASNAEGTTDAFSAATAAVPAPDPAATPTPASTPLATPTAPPLVVNAPPATATPEPSATLSAAFASTGRPAITLRWGETRKITGTLLRADGRPLAGERLAVTSRVRTLDAVPVSLGHVTTDGSGRFTYLPSVGVSRTLVFAYQGRSATVSIGVTPRVTLRFTVAGGLDGRVGGAPSGSRKVVELQRPSGHAWRTFATTRLSAGRFGYRPSRRLRRVRALVRTDASWPLLTGTSAAARR